MSKLTDRISTTGMASHDHEPEDGLGAQHDRLGEPISKPKAIWQCLAYLKREAANADLGGLAVLIGDAADHAAKLTQDNETFSNVNASKR